MYHTGDVAWVHKQDSISNGEIGIFCLNGNTYIKELHDGPDGVYLVSLIKNIIQSKFLNLIL
jgi:Peptidase S24-like.